MAIMDELLSASDNNHYRRLYRCWCPPLPLLVPAFTVAGARLYRCWCIPPSRPPKGGCPARLRFPPVSLAGVIAFTVAGAFPPPVPLKGDAPPAYASHPLVLLVLTPLPLLVHSPLPSP